MPIIRVEMFEGRTRDQKREIVKELTDAFIRTAGGKKEGVHVVLTDVAKENWGAGGELCSDRIPDLKKELN